MGLSYRVDHNGVRGVFKDTDVSFLGIGTIISKCILIVRKGSDISEVSILLVSKYDIYLYPGIQIEHTVELVFFPIYFLLYISVCLK